MSADTTETVMWIVAGLSVVLFLVAIIMSHKSWKIHTLILVFLVFCAACATLWISAQTLKVHQVWREILEGPPGKREEGLIAQTEKLRQESLELEFGKEEDDGEIVEDGIAQLEIRLAEVLYDRGRMWTDCKPAAMAAAAGSVNVTVANPTPSQITPGLLVYVFDGRPVAQSGSYLGMFRVTNVAGGAAAPAPGGGPGDAAAPAGPTIATLQPAWRLSDYEGTRLVDSANRGNPWILFDKMPVDGHQVFAEITAEDIGVPKEQFSQMDRAAQLAKLLPGNVLSEFIKDQQDAEAGDADERIEIQVEFKEDYPDKDAEVRFGDEQLVWLPKIPPPQGAPGVQPIPSVDELVRMEVVERVDDKQPRYSRELRDYGYLFRDLYLNREEQQVYIADVQLDDTDLLRVLTEKQVITDTFKSEYARLSSDRDRFLQELAQLNKLLEDVRRDGSETWRRLVQVRAETLEYARRLDAAQMQAVEAINRRRPPSSAPQARQRAVPKPFDQARR